MKVQEVKPNGRRLIDRFHVCYFKRLAKHSPICYDIDKKRTTLNGYLFQEFLVKN